MKLRISYFSINLVVAIVCFLRGEVHHEYILIGLLPISFAFCLLTSNTIHILYKKYIGIKLLNIVMWIRYTIMPVLVVFSKDLTGVGIEPQTNSINIALLIMVFEMISVFVVVNIAGKRILLNRKLEQSFEVKETDGKPIVYFIIIMLALAFVLAYPDLLNNFSFIVFNENSTVTSHFMGLDIRIIMIAQMALTCIIVTKMGKLYANNNNNIFYIIALVVCLISIMIFKGENRASIFLSIISTLMILKVAFPQKYKISRNLLIIAGLSSLIFLTLYRIYAVTSWRPEGGSQKINIDFFSQTLQAYISGPRNIAIGLEAMNYFKNEINISTLASDVLIWTGYLGNYISDIFGKPYIGTSYMFNLYLHNFNMHGSGDQIIPMSVQSYAYLGQIGSSFFSILAAYFLVVFDSKICKSNTLDSIYINVLFTTVLSLSMGYNLTIAMMYFFDRYLLFYLVSIGNRKVMSILKEK
jgi:hypothetical protein